MFEFFIQILIVAVLAVYAVLLYRFRLKSRFMPSAVLVIFVSGTLLYFLAFSHEPVEEGGVTILIRSMFDSIKLFFFEQELLEVEHIQEEPLFLDFFHLVYAAAMMTTIYALIDVFAKRLKSNFILMGHSDCVYRHVFFGIDRNSAQLATKIDDGRVAFIEFPAPGDEEKANLGNILHGLTRKAVKRNALNSENIDILRASTALCDIERGDGIFKKLGLGRIQKHIDGTTSFYLLSDDVEGNARDIRILESDPFFKDKTIHVTQKQDGLTQQFEMLLSPTGAHFIYPSTLAANLLARDVSGHPVSVMDIPRDENMCAQGYASGMEALVVGFGRMGQAVTRFIYEYMSVPAKDGSEAPSRIYLQDADMENIKGFFISSAPGASHGRKLIYEQIQAGSGLFWTKLTERIDTVSYIVFALPDSELNMRLASEVLSFASARRKGGLKKFKIFVYNREEEDERKAMIDFFNKRYGCENVIRSFGEREKIFTTNMIVSDYVQGLDNESVIGARQIIDRYFRIAGISADSWDHHAEITRSSKENSDYGAIFKERRKLAQYASRYYFILTEMALTSGYLSFEEIPEEVIDRLARCEHYRYVASMEMAGYTPGPKNDELRLVNDRMVRWDDLSDEKKRYYRMIVQATLTE